jgi:hypothetical protein
MSLVVIPFGATPLRKNRAQPDHIGTVVHQHWKEHGQSNVRDFNPFKKETQYKNQSNQEKDIAKFTPGQHFKDTVNHLFTPSPPKARDAVWRSYRRLLWLNNQQ